MDAYEDVKVLESLNLKTDRDGWLNWIHYHEANFIDMIAKVDYRIVWPERVLDGEYGQICEMLDWLGLPWDNEIIDFLNTKIRR